MPDQQERLAALTKRLLRFARYNGYYECNCTKWIDSPRRSDSDPGYSDRYDPSDHDDYCMSRNYAADRDTLLAAGVALD